MPPRTSVHGTGMPWLTSHLSTALVIGAGVAFPIVLVLLALLLLFWVKIYTLVSYTLLSSVLFKPQSHAAADTEGVQMRQFLKTSLVAISVLATLLAANHSRVIFRHVMRHHPSSAEGLAPKWAF